MCVRVCYENVFALQLHVEGVQVRSDVRADEERWRSPSAGRTHGTTWLLDSASELLKSTRRPRQRVPGPGGDSSCGRGWS